MYCYFLMRKMCVIGMCSDVVLMLICSLVIVCVGGVLLICGILSVLLFCVSVLLVVCRLVV